ncbi:hypothetical protein PPERSA_05090 [Pseudocohnilembus persalinus]|uniref:Uncharacterized protein n=1 Tax=Pseudocohnilembus persalinus TaxID=266149 RepID=A0A0V0QWM8_PSEPJ|nr:hypothetical protein PPERSA_05090 [Pseudocohnilembus persalinus]|eukprot:KRX06477.1 hypothetical protein PPERSA_05090 [Pseudocohnilembus persalinus]
MLMYSQIRSPLLFFWNMHRRAKLQIFFIIYFYYSYFVDNNYFDITPLNEIFTLLQIRQNIGSYMEIDYIILYGMVFWVSYCDYESEFNILYIKRCQNLNIM